MRQEEAEKIYDGWVEQREISVGELEMAVSLVVVQITQKSGAAGV
jgi:hypothetical protein